MESVTCFISGFYILFQLTLEFDRADVLRENTEAVFAACDAAHGRWAKLLGVRALLHPKLRLQEFLNIYNITQDFIIATEKVILMLYLTSGCCLLFWDELVIFTY